MNHPNLLGIALQWRSITSLTINDNHALRNGGRRKVGGEEGLRVHK